MVLRILIIFLAFSAYGQELKTITPEQFLAENPSTERKAIVDFIINQFKHKSITQAQLDQLWAHEDARNSFKMARFQIIDQKLYADSFYLGHYYFPMLLDYFQQLLTKYRINDVDFIIYLREEMLMSDELAKVTLGIPAFMMFQDLDSTYETDKLLFPDAYFLKNDWGKLLKHIEQAKTNYPWQQKLEKIFWRGGASGGVYNLANFDKFTRIKVVTLSSLYPDIIDASFLGYFDQLASDQSGKNLKIIFDLLGKSGAEKVNEAEHLKYKYLLSIDGNSATGTRVPWIMCSNSVLLKQDSYKIQWYYAALKPYVHYVPVNERLTDIFSQLSWMQAHDQELQQISLQANNFVSHELMPEHIDAQVALILNQYSNIQQDGQIKVTLTPVEEILALPSLIKDLLYRLKIRLMWKLNAWF